MTNPTQVISANSNNSIVTSFSTLFDGSQIAVGYENGSIVLFSNLTTVTNEQQNSFLFTPSNNINKVELLSLLKFGHKVYKSPQLIKLLVGILFIVLPDYI